MRKCSDPCPSLLVFVRSSSVSGVRRRARIHAKQQRAKRAGTSAEDRLSYRRLPLLFVRESVARNRVEPLERERKMREIRDGRRAGSSRLGRRRFHFNVMLVLVVGTLSACLPSVANANSVSYVALGDSY